MYNLRRVQLCATPLTPDLLEFAPQEDIVNATDGKKPKPEEHSGPDIDENFHPK